MSDSACPARSTLEDLIAGRLSRARHAQCEEHVRGCRECQSEVDTLDEPQDAFLTAFQEAINPTSIQGSGAFQVTLRRLNSLRQEGGAGVGTLPRVELPPWNGDGLFDFRIIRELGRGGMGIVYEAEQLSLQRIVALKILPYSFCADSAQFERFQNEARAAARLEHPNIVPVYAFGIEQGVPFYAMRHIEGWNLAQVIAELRRRVQARESNVSIRDQTGEPAPSLPASVEDLLAAYLSRQAAYFDLVARMAIQAAEALDDAHEHGIIHRDVKPSNLLLDRGGKLWVTDFGLARVEADSSLSVTGAVLGTIRYMSPEQALGQGDAVDRRSDLYSLGATLYELLTLTPVFGDVGKESLLAKIATDDPLPPRRLNRSIPLDLETIVLKALSRNAAERYTTAAEFADDLGRFVDGKAIRARAVGPLRRSIRRIRHRPALIALSGVCLLSVLGAVAGMWWHLASLRSMQAVAEELRRDGARQQESIVEQSDLARERERRLRRFGKAADLRLAKAAWNNNQIVDALELLTRQRPRPGERDERSFAWYYLWGLCHGERRTLHGHTSDVHCVVFSPDGRWIASASHDGTAKLWDASTGAEIATYLRGHTDQLNALAFSPDSQVLATGGDDTVIRLWDVARGEVLAAMPGHSADVNSLAFSPGGAILASGASDRLVKLWDVAKRNELATLNGHSGGIRSVAFSADGNTLASAGFDRTVVLWDLSTRQARATLRGHDDTVGAVAFSHAGSLMATGSDDRTVKLWDATTGTEQATLRGHGEIIRSVAFSPDDATLAVAVKDSSVWLWDVAQARVRQIIRGHQGRVWQAAYSPDGRMLATGSQDRTVKIWNAEGNAGRKTLAEIPSVVMALSFSPAGQTVMAIVGERGARTRTLRLWDAATGMARPSQNIGGPSTGHAAFSHDGQCAVITCEMNQLAYDRQSYRIADLNSFTVYLHNPARELSPSFYRCLAVSADHRLFVTAWPGMLTANDLNTGTEVDRLVDESGTTIASAAFHPQTRTVAIGYVDGRSVLWNIASGTKPLTMHGHTHGIHDIAFSPDGSLLATASGDQTLKLWDRAGVELATLRGHMGSVRSAAFSPDGKTLCSGGDDGIVRVFDVETFQELLTLEGHHGSVQFLAFSPSGRDLASVSIKDDDTSEIMLWPGALGDL